MLSGVATDRTADVRTLSCAATPYYHHGVTEAADVRTLSYAATPYYHQGVTVAAVSPPLSEIAGLAMPRPWSVVDAVLPAP